MGKGGEKRWKVKISDRMNDTRELGLQEKNAVQRKKFSKDQIDLHRDLDELCIGQGVLLCNLEDSCDPYFMQFKNLSFEEKQEPNVLDRERNCNGHWVYKVCAIYYRDYY